MEDWEYEEQTEACEAYELDKAKELIWRQQEYIGQLIKENINLQEDKLFLQSRVHALLAYQGSCQKQ